MDSKKRGSKNLDTVDTTKETRKRAKSIATTRRKDTKSSLGSGSKKSTNSNKVSNKSKLSNKSKSSNKSKLSGKSGGTGSNVSKDSKGKPKNKRQISISSGRSAKGKGRKSMAKIEESKPKRTFNFDRNSSQGEDKLKNRKGSRRISKGSVKNKKGSFSNKGKKGSQEESIQKREQDGHVQTAEEQLSSADEFLRGKQVHFQLRYNEWTYFDYIPENSRVLDLKLRIYMYTRIQPYKQKLYLMRKKMKEHKTIDEYGMIPEWYDTKRPALLFLKYRDKCLEKLPKTPLELTPVQSPDDFVEEHEGPELLAPPPTPIEDSLNKPVAGQKKVKLVKESKIGSGKTAKEQGEVKLKLKDTMDSVLSKEKKKDQVEKNVISKSEISESEQGSSGRKTSKINAAKKRLKSMAVARPNKAKEGLL